MKQYHSAMRDSLIDTDHKLYMYHHDRAAYHVNKL